MTTFANIQLQPLSQADYKTLKGDFIQKAEGIGLKVYLDSEGIATIGIGFK